MNLGLEIRYSVFFFDIDLGFMRNEKTFRLKNRGHYAVSPDEAFTVIEKLSYTLCVFAFLLVVGIIYDEQYMACLLYTSDAADDLP